VATSGEQDVKRLSAASGVGVMRGFLRHQALALWFMVKTRISKRLQNER